MSRHVWRLCGFGALALGSAGIVLPLLPTVPLFILAAWCFGKSHPTWEARLLRHPRFGPHIRAWRERRAIAPIGKIMALVAMTISVTLSFFWLQGGVAFLPLAICGPVAVWIVTRPSV